MISFIKPKGNKRFCNVKLKQALIDKHRVFISIGSACHTQKNHASHVLHALRAPFIVRCGVIRISLGDYNTISECREMTRKIIQEVKKQ